MNRILLTSLLTGICGLAMAADPQPPQQPHPQDGRRQGPPPQGMNQMMLKRVDDTMAKLTKADGGKLTAERRAALDKELDQKELTRQQRAINEKLRDARMYAVFKILDTNEDGVLDEAEKEKATENFQKFLQEHPESNPMRGMGMMGPGMRPPRGGMDPGGRPRPPRGGKGGMKDGKGGRPPKHGEGENPPPTPPEEAKE
ncbi:MAG: hypothetical protein IJJ33_19725 [Victivallales bacterium]|nr:hypothetical protein [Victivallales bacterium]